MKKFKQKLPGVDIFSPDIKNQIDNGSMIAITGYHRLKNGQTDDRILVSPDGIYRRYKYDKIFINDLQVKTVIRIFDWEREIKQTISINLEMEFDISKAAKSDDINDSPDYKKVSKRIISLCEKADSYLVENLIEKIAQVVLKEFPVSKVTVSLENLCFKGLKKRRYKNYKIISVRSIY